MDSVLESRETGDLEEIHFKAWWQRVRSWEEMVGFLRGTRTQRPLMTTKPGKVRLSQRMQSPVQDERSRFIFADTGKITEGFWKRVRWGNYGFNTGDLNPRVEGRDVGKEQLLNTTARFQIEQQKARPGPLEWEEEGGCEKASRRELQCVYVL